MAGRLGVEFGPQGDGGGQVVGPIEQQGATAPAHLLQPAGPAGAGEAAADPRRVDRPAPLRQGPKHPQGHGAVARLHDSRQPQGPGVQIQGLHPVQLGPHRPGLGGENRRHSRVLGAAEGAGSRLEHAGLLGGNRGWIRPQNLGVVETDRGKADHAAVGMAGGGIEPAPQTHLQHHQLQFRCGKGQEGCGSYQFKRRQQVAAGGRRGPLQLAAQVGDANRPGSDQDPLAPAHQVGGGVEAGAQARGQ